MTWRPISELTVDELRAGPVEIWRGTDGPFQGDPYPNGGWHAFVWPEYRLGWVGTTTTAGLRGVIKEEIVEEGWTHWRHVAPPPEGAEINPMWADAYLVTKGKRR